MALMEDRAQSGQRSWETEMFRLLVENVRDYAILVVDTDGRVQHWNPGAERLLGYRADEIIGQSADRFFTPEDVENDVPRQERNKVLATGRNEDDRWHVRKDGFRIWSSGVMTPLYDERGELRGFAKIMRDRTELKRGEQELARVTQQSQQRQRLYEAALSNTPDLVYVFGLDHRFLYANEGLLTMWGRTWDEAIGKNCLELGYPSWHAAMHDREIEQVVATKQPIKGEAPFTGTFGRRIYEYIFVPVLGENGEVEAVAGTTRDVTDRKRAEVALRESEQRFARFMQHLPGLAWIKDLQGRYVYANDAAVKAFRTPRTELYGKTDEEIFPPQTAAQFKENDRLALGSEAGVQVIETLEHEDGTLHHSLVSKFPILGSEEEVVLVGGMAIDITDRLRAEEASRRPIG